MVSFGFKYGLPVDADLVFDLRFLPNPHFVPELRPKTGREPEVAAYVLEAEPTKELLADLRELLAHALPRYEREGKAYLTIAVGCTGGRHRSVAVAEQLGDWLRDRRATTRSWHTGTWSDDRGRAGPSRSSTSSGCTRARPPSSCSSRRASAPRWSSRRRASAPTPRA